MAEAKVGWVPSTPRKSPIVIQSFNDDILTKTGGGCGSSEDLGNLGGYAAVRHYIKTDSAKGEGEGEHAERETVSPLGLGFPGTIDKGLNPETTRDGFRHMGVTSGSAEPLRMERNGSFKKRSHKGIDLDKHPRKRMRMKRHRPKVFDETRPPQTRRPKSRTRTGPSTPNPQTPGPSTPKPWTQSHAKHVEKNVGSSSSSYVRTSRRRKLDFSKESSILDGISKACNHMQNEPEVEQKKSCLNILVKDVGCRDPDRSYNLPKADSSITDQNSKACNGIETKPEVEDTLNILGDSCKDISSCDLDKSSIVQDLDVSMESCIREQNTTKACTKVENEAEVEPKGQSNYGLSSLKVYQRKSIMGNRVMNQTSKACDGIENKTEVEPNLHSNNGPGRKVYRRILRANECLKSSRKLGPNCPYMCKGRRTRRLKTTVFDKLIMLVGKILRAQRQRRKKKQMHSDFIEENPMNPRNLSPRKKSLAVCDLDFKSKGSTTAICGGNLLCLNNAVSRGKRSKTTSRRKDYSSLITKLSAIQVPEAFHRGASNIRTQEKNVMPKCEGHLAKLNNVRLCVRGPRHEPRTPLHSHDYFPVAMVDYIVKRMRCLYIGDRRNQLVVRIPITQVALVTSKGKIDHSKKRKQLPKVDLDLETMRVWNNLMEGGWSEDTEQQEDNDKTEYWKEQKTIFSGRVDSFIAKMHLIQGDRRFSPWKGSVVDSVVGVFLTQNVSDHLSSSAFMNLASKYPPPFLNKESGCDDGSNRMIDQIQHVELAEPSSAKSEELIIMEKHPSSTPCDEAGIGLENVNEISFQPESANGKPNENVSETPEGKINWDELRTKSGRSRNRTGCTQDSVNWEAVRQAPAEEVAKVIMERGMNNVLAIRIKEFLDRLVKDHGSIDLEWLRDVPPDKIKDYLLSITGLGLKSVECVRLLCLRHHAFPVDTNVARILVRLGWVPLQPLPGDIQIHLLNDYPPMDTIQKYIWPRLCYLSQLTLYELHYQMITFGKLFCTKSKPNCNACPMRGECRHFASAYASGNLRLEDSKDKNKATESSVPPVPLPTPNMNLEIISEVTDYSLEGTDQYYSSSCEPIVEYPASPEPEPELVCTEIPDIEEFGSKPACTETLERDIENFGYDSSDEGILIVNINDEEEFKENDVLRHVGEEEDVSKVLEILTPEIGSIPMPRLKFVGRLRTMHFVYELPDSHPILAGFEEREPGDPCPYLFATWSRDDLPNSFQLGCNSQTCFSGEIVQYQNDTFVRGTILIPCRTANRGSFPLNGTYFQVNEVFADHASSRVPITVPGELIRKLRQRALFCGTSASTICRGMLLQEIIYTFRLGFICIRGFDRTDRAPKPLGRRFHLYKTKKVEDD